MRITQLIGITLILLSRVAVAGDLETGMERYFAKDYAGAFGPLLSAATQGDANAQGLLGVMYSGGQGLARDDAQAAAWTSKAAQQGMAAAQARLGNMYRQGIGVPQDYALAYQWFEKSALQSSALGQFSMAFALSIGQGTAMSEELATSWYMKAAQQGFAEAQLKLALRFDTGLGVAKDPKAAASWYEKAAAQGNAPAMYFLGLMYADGAGVVKDPSRAKILWTKAAALGDQAAIAELAERARAAEPQAMENMQQCERLATASLDDGVSPADVIATAVVARCSRERDMWIQARYPGITDDRLREIRVVADRQALPATTATVLEFRATKRRAPGAQPRSQAKPKPET